MPTLPVTDKIITYQTVNTTTVADTVHSLKLKQLKQLKQLKLKLKTALSEVKLKTTLPEQKHTQKQKLKTTLPKMKQKQKQHDTVPFNFPNYQQLISFPRSSFPSCFHSIMGNNFIYHPNLYITHSSWVDAILPIIKLLITSFRVQYICFLPNRLIIKLYPLQCVPSQLTSIAPA